MKHMAFNHGNFLASPGHFVQGGMLCRLALSALLLFSPHAVRAAEDISPVTAKFIPTHHVVAGDTLYKLARTYLDDPAQWREFLRYNKVKNPRRLVPGSELHIPPSSAYATVIFTHGDVSLAPTNSQLGKLVEVGDILTEGATVNVGSNSYLSMQFSDASIIRVLSDSVLQLRKLRESSSPKAQKLSRIMQLGQGNLDISVTPSKAANTGRRTRPNTFEIVTPMAVAAVRGTRFDVSASNSGMTSGVTTGSVDIRQNTPARNAKHALLATGTGIQVSNDGKLGQVRALLPAPDLSAMPDIIQDADYIALGWQGLAGAASYHIRIANDADMHTVLHNLESVEPAIKLQSLANGNYVLGIRAVDADGVIGYEATHAFNILATPTYPFYLQPADKQTVGSKVVLECTEVQGVDSYHMQISRDETFAIDVIDADQLSACSHTISKLENGHYYWRVASITKSRDGDLQGPYSSPSQFDVDEANAGSKDRPVTAYWTNNRPLILTAQIARDAGFANIIQEKTLESSQIGLDGLPSGTYYLRLQAKDADGYLGAYSAPRIIEIKVVEQVIERTWADKAK